MGCFTGNCDSFVKSRNMWSAILLLIYLLGERQTEDLKCPWFDPGCLPYIILITSIQLYWRAN